MIEEMDKQADAAVNHIFTTQGNVLKLGTEGFDLSYGLRLMVNKLVRAALNGRGDGDNDFIWEAYTSSNEITVNINSLDPGSVNYGEVVFNVNGVGAFTLELRGSDGQAWVLFLARMESILRNTVTHFEEWGWLSLAGQIKMRGQHQSVKELRLENSRATIRYADGYNTTNVVGNDSLFIGPGVRCMCLSTAAATALPVETEPKVVMLPEQYHHPDATASERECNERLGGFTDYFLAVLRGEVVSADGGGFSHTLIEEWDTAFLRAKSYLDAMMADGDAEAFANVYSKPRAIVDDPTGYVGLVARAIAGGHVNLMLPMDDKDADGDRFYHIHTLQPEWGCPNIEGVPLAGLRGNRGKLDHCAAARRAFIMEWIEHGEKDGGSFFVSPSSSVRNALIVLDHVIGALRWHENRSRDRLDFGHHTVQHYMDNRANLKTTLKTMVETAEKVDYLFWCR